MVRQTKKSFSQCTLSCDPVGCIAILSWIIIETIQTQVQSGTLSEHILWLIVISYLQHRKLTSTVQH